MPGWKTESYGGATRDIYYQSHTDSCALACVAMAINRKTGSKPTERAIMNMIGVGRRRTRPPGGYVAARDDQFDPNDSLWAGADYVGTKVQGVIAYLRAYGVRARESDIRYGYRGAIGDALFDTATNPIIALVSASGREGKHFIFFDGFPVGSEPTTLSEFPVVICDPEKGLGIAPRVYCMESTGSVVVRYQDDEHIRWNVANMAVLE